MKIVMAMFKYGYGIKSKGYSLEYEAFLPALKSITPDIYPFWLEENGYESNGEIINKNNLEKNLLAFVNGKSPDIIMFMLMRDEFSINFLNDLKKKYVTVNWFGDDQWRFESFTKFYASCFTVPITTDKYSISKYKALGCESVRLSQWSTFDYQSNLHLEDINYEYDISFVGGKDIVRAWLISELAKSGLKVHCFGEKWPLGRKSYNEMKKVFLHTKINLNLSNSVPSDYRFFVSLLKRMFLLDLRAMKFLAVFFRNKLLKKSGLKDQEQMKARNFEVPGFGGFILCNYVVGLEDYYDIGREIGVYTNTQDLIKQIKYYLANDKLREQMKKRAFLRTRNYTYEKRLTEVVRLTGRAKVEESCLVCE